MWKMEKEKIRDEKIIKIEYCEKQATQNDSM